MLDPTHYTDNRAGFEPSQFHCSTLSFTLHLNIVGLCETTFTGTWTNVKKGQGGESRPQVWDWGSNHGLATSVWLVVAAGLCG